MSYADREKSEYSGHPLELYRFSLGGEQWLFTSADHEVYFGTDAYQPVFIQRDGFTRTADARKSTMTVKVSATNPLALLFRTGWLAATMILTIYRHHYGDSDFTVLWKGRVTGCTWAGNIATITSDSVFTLFRRAGLRRVYQIGCPHVLYGAACGLDQAAWAVAAAVTAVSGTQVTLSGIGAYPTGYFTGGMVQAGADMRMITAHTGSVISMVDVIAGLDDGDAVTLWPGCARSLSACNSKFGNVANFGGLPYLPAKNPFSGDALV